MHLTSPAVTVALTSLSLLSACGRVAGAGATGTTTTTSAFASNTIVTHAQAVTEITNVACDRDGTCRATRGPATLSSDGACKEVIADYTRATLGAPGCRKGIHERDLSACVQALHAEPCGAPASALSRLTECSEARMCR